MARVKKTEKKAWFVIVAPKLFHNQVVGEILLTSPSNAVGRIIPVNLASLARDPRRQNITVKLRVASAAGEKLHTEIAGYQMSQSFMKRMVRKGGDKVEYSFAVETADSKKLRLKTILLCRRKINLSVKTALRRKIEEILKKDAKKTSFIELMQLIVAHKVQGSLKKQLSKIYPLKSFEIRNAKIEKDKKTAGEEKPAVKKAVKPKIPRPETKEEPKPEEKKEPKKESEEKPQENK